MNAARQRPHPSRRDSDVSSHGTWDSDDENDERRDGNGTPGEEGTAEVPRPLRITKSQQDIRQEQEGLPDVLKPGPVGGVAAGARVQGRKSTEELRYEDEAQGNPWASPTSGREESHGALPYSSSPSSNNPYRQQTGFAQEQSQNAWQAAPPQPVAAPPPPTAAPPAPPAELPTAPRTPADELSQLSLGNQHEQRPQPKPFETAEILAVPQQGRPPLASVVEQSRQESQDFYSNNPWRTPSQESQHQHVEQPPAAPPKDVTPPRPQQQQYAPPPGPPPKASASTSLIDYEEPPSRAAEAPRPAPISTAQPSQPRSSVPETPGTRDKRQRSEHYQIKHVNWYDASHKEMRRSPILTQNANGPCPLLALVNALVLTTPPSLNTALVETLQTREQVSLGLLLDAVFDELMSGRRGETATQLPDVGELYAFLLALHTGMNVNPRFITLASAPRGSLDGVPPDKTGLHPVERAQAKAGCFEETKEMKLYSTFNVPLIHGWTAPKDTPAYSAMERNAQTFEDAQNIQFLESELEDKLRSEGLSGPEQQVLQDIQTIKAFLQTWPTQLTDYGLETMSASLRPAQFAILFRNDHFSTVYKEPRSGALMTLVTDAGYSSHEEVVWEGLVDVSGAASEMYSGDFRAVSHGQDARLQGGEAADGGWTTVQGRNNRNAQSLHSRAGSSPEVPPPLPGPRPAASQATAPIPAHAEEDLGIPANTHQRTASEQEDHDLALALQLQEEEEEQQRQAETRRRREQELSEQFLSTEGEGPRPPIPPRRSGTRNSNVPVTVSGGGGGGRSGSGAPTGGRPPVNRRADDPDAPPTYEQSASDRPYRPAGATAPSNLAQGNPLNAYDALRRQQSAYVQQSSTSINGGAPPNAAAGGYGGRRQSGQVPPGRNRVRRRSSQMGVPPGAYAPGSPAGPSGGQRPVGQAAGIRDAEDKCVVM